SFLCTPPPTASPLFPYTTLFRSDFAAADLGERLRHEDAEQRLGVFLAGAVVIREPAVQAEPREDVIPKRVEFGQDENGVDLWRVGPDARVLQPVVLLFLVRLEGDEQLRDRAVVSQHFLVCGRVDLRRHLTAVDQDADDNALQELLDERPRGDPGLDELLDVFARHVVGGEPKGRERVDPVLLPDVVRQLADDLAEVTEDESEFRDLFLQRGARESAVFHSFVDRRHDVQRLNRRVETEVILDPRPVFDLGAVEEPQECRFPGGSVSQECTGHITVQPRYPYLILTSTLSWMRRPTPDEPRNLGPRVRGDSCQTLEECEVLVARIVRLPAHRSAPAKPKSFVATQGGLIRAHPTEKVHR